MKKKPGMERYVLRISSRDGKYYIRIRYDGEMVSTRRKGYATQTSNLGVARLWKEHYNLHPGRYDECEIVQLRFKTPKES